MVLAAATDPVCCAPRMIDPSLVASQKDQARPPAQPQNEVVALSLAAPSEGDASDPGAALPESPTAPAAAQTPSDTFTPEMDRFRALAAQGSGPTESVYVCQILPAEGAGPATSLTILGGAPPAAASSPRLRAARHILTIDLLDAPELASRFPGARAASLFAPRDTDFDDDAPQAFYWRPWTEAQVAPDLAALGSRPRTLVVHKCDVPTSTFSHDGDAALRAALTSFPGYLLGGPITLKKETASKGPSFVAQLTEAFDLPLGAAGQLYSYTDHSKWDSR